VFHHRIAMRSLFLLLEILLATVVAAQHVAVADQNGANKEVELNRLLQTVDEMDVSSDAPSDLPSSTPSIVSEEGSGALEDLLDDFVQFVVSNDGARGRHGNKTTKKSDRKQDTIPGVLDDGTKRVKRGGNKLRGEAATTKHKKAEGKVDVAGGIVEVADIVTGGGRRHGRKGGTTTRQQNKKSKDNIRFLQAEDEVFMVSDAPSSVPTAVPLLLEVDEMVDVVVSDAPSAVPSALPLADGVGSDLDSEEELMERLNDFVDFVVRDGAMRRRRRGPNRNRMQPGRHQRTNLMTPSLRREDKKTVSIANKTIKNAIKEAEGKFIIRSSAAAADVPTRGRRQGQMDGRRFERPTVVAAAGIRQHNKKSKAIRSLQAADQVDVSDAPSSVPSSLPMEEADPAGDASGLDPELGELINDFAQFLVSSNSVNRRQRRRKSNRRREWLETRLAARSASPTASPASFPFIPDASEIDLEELEALLEDFVDFIVRARRRRRRHDRKSDRQERKSDRKEALQSLRAPTSGPTSAPSSSRASFATVVNDAAQDLPAIFNLVATAVIESRQSGDASSNTNSRSVEDERSFLSNKSESRRPGKRLLQSEIETYLDQEDAVDVSDSPNSAPFEALALVDLVEDMGDLVEDFRDIFHEVVVEYLFRSWIRSSRRSDRQQLIQEILAPVPLAAPSASPAEGRSSIIHQDGTGWKVLPQTTTAPSASPAKGRSSIIKRDGTRRWNGPQRAKELSLDTQSEDEMDWFKTPSVRDKNRETAPRVVGGSDLKEKLELRKKENRPKREFDSWRQDENDGLVDSSTEAFSDVPSMNPSLPPIRGPDVDASSEALLSDFPSSSPSLPPMRGPSDVAGSTPLDDTDVAEDAVKDVASDTVMTTIKEERKNVQESGPDMSPEEEPSSESSSSSTTYTGIAALTGMAAGLIVSATALFFGARRVVNFKRQQQDAAHGNIGQPANVVDSTGAPMNHIVFLDQDSRGAAEVAPGPFAARSFE
jgi:hypothetical protein